MGGDGFGRDMQPDGLYMCIGEDTDRNIHLSTYGSAVRRNLFRN